MQNNDQISKDLLARDDLTFLVYFSNICRNFMDGKPLSPIPSLKFTQDTICGATALKPEWVKARYERIMPFLRGGLLEAEAIAKAEKDQQDKLAAETARIKAKLDKDPNMGIAPPEEAAKIIKAAQVAKVQQRSTLTLDKAKRTQ
jgi:hypothetical protein